MRTEIREVKSQNGTYVLELAASPFRKAAGGQPCDFGFVSSSNFNSDVIDVLENNCVLVKTVEGIPETGECIAQIDEKRRNILTRMHTAEHILFRSLQNFEKSVKLDKISLTETISSIFFFADNIEWNIIFKGEELANRVIKENKKITERTIKKEEVGNIDNLRIKTERIKSEDVRVVEIEDHDKSACAGTHCHSTSEVGSVLVITLLGTKSPYELKFIVDTEDKLFVYAKAARELSSLLGTETEKLVSTTSNLKAEVERYKSIARNAPLEVKEIGSLQVISVEGYDSKDLIYKAGKLVKENSVLIAINKMPKGSQVSIFAGISSNKDAGEIFRQLSKKFNGKGNGRKEFASGMLESDAEAIIKEM